MYEDRLVCFIDILGFKELIELSVLPIDSDKLLMLGDDRPRSAKDVYGILESLSYILEIHKEDHYNPESERYKELIKYRPPIFQQGDIPDFQFSILSDSIVFSVNRLSTSTIMLFCDMVEAITSLLFEVSSTCRGGITWGKLYHSDNVVFGPAFIAAYQIEQKAVYPRVIISQEIIQMLSGNDLKELLKIRLTQDDDKYYFVDIIKYYASCQQYNEIVTSFTHQLHWLLTLYLDHPDLQIRDKYNWYRMRFNKLLKKVKKLVKAGCREEYYREEFLNLPYFK